MKISELKLAVIPELSSYCAAQIIQADQPGPKPKGNHVTYKITTPYGKGVGRQDEITQTVEGILTVTTIDEYKTTLSFSAYALDDDESIELAQMVYDWFASDGVQYLQDLGVAVVEQTDIINRDAFIINGYERRNGFDVILRITRVKTTQVDALDVADVIVNKIKGGFTQ